MKEKQRAFPKKSKPISQRISLDNEIQQLQSQYESLSTKDLATIKRFHDFPLSQKTIKGLVDAKFSQPTDIQRESIGPALQGKDVLAAAITGSGKTLAFLIPVLEHLFISKWTRTDGVAAVIISPTRELAYQIFETLKKVGKYHDFSAGLIIGGKNLKFERTRMDQCNILICTPGRLLQHMDENPIFNASTMEVLVLDEADRCLDMGFEQTLNAIIENFPPQRQTLLFSATQTNSVKDLARLNLNNPVLIGHPDTKVEAGKTQLSSVKVVPDLLQQNYVVIELEDKITMLWSFIKNHLKQKIIVFLSSCKQVKYIFEIFCKLRPGTSLLALYGTLHQDRRIAIYNDFVKKSNVVLFATDIASRGLDFPSVNWVVQLDCPEDVTQYIHRAGRSARNKARGESLLVLLASEEEGMVEELGHKSITIRKILIDPKKLFSPRAKIEAYLAQNPELKASAQRAFVAYIKSVFLMKNKNIFKVMSMNFDAYAKSLGLVVTPRVRFLDRFLKKQNQQNKSEPLSDSENEREVKTKPNASMSLFETSKSDSESDGEDFIKIKRVNHDIKGNQNSDGEQDELGDLPPPVLRKKEKLITKAALAKKALKKNLTINEKVKFDEEGREIADSRKQLQSELAKEYESKVNTTGGIDIEMAKQLLQEEDKYDKQRFRSLVKQKHKKLKEKLKRQDEEEAAVDAEDNDDDGGEYSEGESENSVDLSWLPDPNKIYKNESNSEEESDEETNSRKGNKFSKKLQRRRQDSSEDDHDVVNESDDDFAEPVRKKANVTSKLTLDDAEIIAQQLLGNGM
ncbi:probable ATP-dependent RNA helicase DDX10 [Stomoxys calcitrans]|uniref:probable ATP-dependent RNA helicase DDX10 n=1 Tax=Stomoxys calcitrans TaxID=35570 RepID=UPI0027E246D3|nr:probable ATP-dependent RNA helicase DDX10 [Stomoxys calcitrans]